MQVLGNSLERPGCQGIGLFASTASFLLREDTGPPHLIQVRIIVKYEEEAH